MNRLQKFVEKGAYGEGPLRVAYVLDADKLPAPIDGGRWDPSHDFNAGDELLGNMELKDVFKAAVDNGYAIVDARSPGN
jgi:hypothetical protein